MEASKSWPAESSIPDMIEEDFLVNKITALSFPLKLLKEKDDSAREERLKDRLRSLPLYSEYWKQQLSLYRNSTEIPDSVKKAIETRYELIRGKLIPQVDAILDNLRYLADKLPFFDTNAVADLVEKGRKLLPIQGQTREKIVELIDETTLLPGDSPTPDEVERHFFGNNITRVMFVLHWYKDKSFEPSKVESEMRDALRSLKKYGDYWTSELVTVLTNKDEAARQRRIKNAIEARYKFVREKVLWLIDDILDDLRKMAGEEHLDFERIQDLVDEYKNLEPGEARDEIIKSIEEDDE